MFDITAEDVKDLNTCVKLLDSQVNLSQLGQWGVLHLCCGARASSSREWQNAILSDWRIPSAAEVLSSSLPFTGTPADYAATFADYIVRWVTDTNMHEFARQRLEAASLLTRTVLGSNKFMIQYLALAICLNSCQTLEIEDFTAVRDWAGVHPCFAISTNA